MTDVSLNYQDIRDSAKKLDLARTEIDEKLIALQKMIAGLVGSSFKTQTASGRFKESYDQWTTGANNVIKGLEGMSTFLHKAVQTHEDADRGLNSGLSS